MTFLWPLLLVGLAVVPALVALYIWRLRRRRPSGVRYSSLSLVRAAAPGSGRLRRHLPFAMFALALAVLGLALARPVAIASVPANETTIVLVIDVSGSMCSNDVDPYRLRAAENAAAAFIRQQGANTQIGIVAFSGFAQLVQPPTNDQAALLNALASLTTGRRTALGSGILEAIDAIAAIDPTVAPATGEGRPGSEPAPLPPGDYAPDIIVALTDGATNTGFDPQQAAQEAATRGIRTYTIGFGTPQGGQLDPTCATQFLGREPGNFPGFGGGAFGGQFGGGGNGFRRGIDDQALMQIATTTGAKYYPAESASQLEGVFASLPVSLIFKHEVVELSVAFTGVGGVLAAIAVLLGRRWRPLP
ncbi:MAG TPA: VWA domain-containing protein [Candidatus Limnocylindrales bacterium]|nr:VWA domain-containing protein [Candidatus Limnocylindrales bacterium]